MAIPKNKAGAKAPAAQAMNTPSPVTTTVSPDSSVPEDEAAIIEEMKPVVVTLGNATKSSIEDYIKLGALACKLRDVVERKEKPKPKPQRRRVEDVLGQHFGASASTIYRMMRFGEDKERKWHGVTVPTGPTVIRAAIAKATSENQPLPADVSGLDEFQRQYNRATLDEYDAALQAEEKERTANKAKAAEAKRAKQEQQERGDERLRTLVSEYRRVLNFAIQMMRNNDVDPTSLLEERAKIEEADLALVLEGDPHFEVVSEVGPTAYAERRAKAEEYLRQEASKIGNKPSPKSLEAWLNLGWRAFQQGGIVLGQNRNESEIVQWAGRIVGRSAKDIERAMRLFARGNKIEAARIWAREQGLAEADDYTLDAAEELLRMQKAANTRDRGGCSADLIAFNQHR